MSPTPCPPDWYTGVPSVFDVGFTSTFTTSAEARDSLAQFQNLTPYEADKPLSLSASFSSTVT